jgi:hypothetical protein
MKPLPAGSFVTHFARRSITIWREGRQKCVRRLSALDRRRRRRRKIG